MFKINYSLVFIICATAFSGEAFALTAPTLFGNSQNMNATVSIANLASQNVTCHSNEPQLQDSAAMFDCLNSSFNFSLSGIFGFDLNSMLNNLRSQACNYANSATANLQNKAQQQINQQVTNVTSQVLGNTGSTIVNQAIRAGTQNGTTTVNTGATGTTVTTQQQGQPTQTFNPFQ